MKQRLGELYALNRGALYANSLVQAQTAFEQRDSVKTQELVQAARGLFEKRHRKKLNQDPERPDGKRKASKKERLALVSKQSRIREILGIFDEVLGLLEPMARLQLCGRPPTATGESHTAARRAAGFQEEYDAAATAQGRLQVIERHFELQSVASEQDIRPDTLYYVQGKESHVIRSAPQEQHADPVSMTVVPSGRRMKPIAVERLLELGSKGQLLRMVPRAAEEAAVEPGSAARDTDYGEQAHGPGQMMGSCGHCILDVGSFTQLATLAQQSGIVPGADQISHVRDREFRIGEYHTAFNVIERLWVKFGQAADQRQQRLRTEEIQYKAGKLKMSPKQWMLKQARDTQQTLIIERTRRNFTRVLDGLRILAIPK